MAAVSGRDCLELARVCCFYLPVLLSNIFLPFPSSPLSPPVTALLHCAAGCVWLNTLISNCHVIALVGKVVQKVILPLTAVQGPKERKGKLAMCFLVFNYNKFDLLCQSLLAHTHTLAERGRKVEARSCAVTKMN